MSRKQHWEKVYTTKPTTAVSWFQSQPEPSLALIQATQPSPLTPMIDVGGGASVLVDYLAKAGYQALTVLDISGVALALTQDRLQSLAAGITWLEADITQVQLPAAYYGVWHDRAVFHFLTDPSDRRQYRDQLLHSLRPDGHVVMGTFALDGPQRCSGLEIVRYSPETLQAELGAFLQLQGYQFHDHYTPNGTLQRFLYCHFTRSSES